MAYGPYGGLIDSSNALSDGSGRYVTGPTASYMGATGQGQPGQMFNTSSKQWETPPASYYGGNAPSSGPTDLVTGRPQYPGLDQPTPTNTPAYGSNFTPGPGGSLYDPMTGKPTVPQGSGFDQANRQGDMMGMGGGPGMSGSITGGLNGLAGMDPGMMQRLFSYMNQFRNQQTAPMGSSTGTTVDPSTQAGWGLLPGQPINARTVPYRVPPGGDTSGAFYTGGSNSFNENGPSYGGLTGLSTRMGNNAYSGMSPFKTSQGFRGY